MYNAEVLSKFPVVQHFPFGSLFSWETDPNAPTPITTTHVSSQPSSHTVSVTGDTGGAPMSRPPTQDGMKAPWTTQSNAAPITTSAPWANHAPSSVPVATAAPWAKTRSPPAGMSSTKAPWASSDAGAGMPMRLPPNQPLGMPPTRAPWTAGPSSASDDPTRAPWAKATTDSADSKGR
jgi:serine/threonine-protein phosphatase 2A activator